MFLTVFDYISGFPITDFTVRQAMNYTVLMILSVVLTYVATYLAKRTDLKSIEDPPITAYLVLIVSAVILYPVYKANPMLLIVNLLALGFLATILNVLILVYNLPIIGAYDLVFIYLESVALTPIPIDGAFLPTTLIHFTISSAIGIYQLTVKKKPFVRFFEIHENVARYLLFAYGLILLLIYLFS